MRRVSRLPAPARSFAGSLVRWLAPRVTARLVALSHPVQWRDRSSTALHQPGPCISTVPKQRRRNVRCTYRCVLVTCSRADAVSWPRPLAQSLRAQSKKKPNKKLISCPFCLGEFEDVTLHLESCSSATGGGGGGGSPAAASTASSPSVATPTKRTPAPLYEASSEPIPSRAVRLPGAAADSTGGLRHQVLRSTGSGVQTPNSGSAASPSAPSGLSSSMSSSSSTGTSPMAMAAAAAAAAASGSPSAVAAAVRAGGGGGGNSGWVAVKKDAPVVDYNKATINGEVWDKVLDADSKEYYYWNRTTGAVQWTPPEGFPIPPTPAPTPAPTPIPQALSLPSLATPSTPHVSSSSFSSQPTTPVTNDSSPEAREPTTPLSISSASASNASLDPSGSPSSARSSARDAAKMFSTLRKKKVPCPRVARPAQPWSILTIASHRYLPETRRLDDRARG